MPALAAMIYLLLALRVRVELNVSLWGTHGCMMIAIGAAGFYLRYDGRIVCDENGIMPKVISRYVASARQKNEKKSRAFRVIRKYLRLAREGKMEQLSFCARVGLGDAGETAVVSGCLRAIASVLFSFLDRRAAQELQVMPDFDNAGFCAQLRCIFSWQPGDIMLAAMKAACRKNGREGLGWKSILLRA